MLSSIAATPGRPSSRILVGISCSTPGEGHSSFQDPTAEPAMLVERIRELWSSGVPGYRGPGSDLVPPGDNALTDERYTLRAYLWAKCCNFAMP